MPKQSGLAQALYVAGRDLSGDTQQYSIGSPQDVFDMTGIDKSAYERIGGLRSGALDWTSFFNPDALQEHATLSPLPTTDLVTMVATGTALGSPAAVMVAKQLNYDPSRAASGELTIKVQALSNAYGLEWGVLGTAGKRTESAATNGTGVDLGTAVAAAGFGLQAYIEVFALGSGTPTVKLQGSTDNGGGDAFADITGGTFGVVTATTQSRIATAANLTIERYIRVVTTGTFSGLTFAVVICPNLTSTVF